MIRSNLKYFYYVFLTGYIIYLLLFVKLESIERWLSIPLTEMNNASLLIIITFCYLLFKKSDD